VRNSPTTTPRTWSWTTSSIRVSSESRVPRSEWTSGVACVSELGTRNQGLGTSSTLDEADRQGEALAGVRAGDFDPSQRLALGQLLRGPAHFQAPEQHVVAGT